jgi:uncharacterized protein (TIGR00369 family)
MDELGLPYSTWCFVCGKDNPHGLQTRFHRRGDMVVCEFTPAEHFNGYLGLTHGGVVAAVLDETMGWATCLRAKRFAHTAELTLRFRRPVPTGRPLRVEARAKEPRRRLCAAEAELLNDEGDVLASAEGKFMILTEEETRQVDRMLIYDPQTWRLFAEDEA